MKTERQIKGGVPIGKFDSISISETQDTKPDPNGDTKKYLVLRLLENASDEEGYSGQSKAYSKVCFEDTHSAVFIRAEKAREKEKPVKIMGSFHDVEVQPYTPKDADDKAIKNPTTGETVVGRKITFFVLSDESLQSAIRSRTRSLDFIEETVEGTDTDEQKGEAITEDEEDKTE